ncbi:MAG TPA: nucleotidyltransferase domain-containing protein [Tepidisphaeraceae bacterium]|nr:nucleotidyltransferase domain-containing protein [Tepidisphaeraceae bacterium]
MRTLDQIKLKPVDRQAVSDAARVLRGQFPVQGVILFGSKARGDDDSESDVDLLVLTSQPVTRPMRQQMREAVLPIEMSSDVWMGLTVVWAKDWEQGVYRVLPIRHEIERDGVAA